MKDEKEFWFREGIFGGTGRIVHWKGFAFIIGLFLFLMVSESALSAAGLFKDHFWIGLIPFLIAFFVGVVVVGARTGPWVPKQNGD